MNDNDPKTNVATATGTELYAKLKSWFELEHQRQQVNRYQMALDADYYDGSQWLPHEAAAIRRRGQNPIVFNEVKPTIDWLIGTERRTRRDFKVLARNTKSDEAENDAKVKTQLLKYLADVNRAPFARSAAFDDAMKAGMGWLEVGITSDPDDEPIYVGSEKWTNMLHDSIGTSKPDLSDSRYLFRFKEVDLDVAQAFFPDKSEELVRAATMGDLNGTGDHGDDEWTGAWPTGVPVAQDGTPMRWITHTMEALNPRQRVSLVECWYRVPTREKTNIGGVSQDRTRMTIRVAVFTKHDLILDAKSPYKHNRFPFVPVWAYRRKSDGLPYGPIRNIRGPQDDLNKRMSKAQFVLSINQLRLEKGAIDKETMDVEELRDEMAAPDGVAIFQDGALSAGKVQVREHGDIAQGHLALADRDSAAIRSVSGVTMEQRGEASSAASGRAILAKQDQGQMVTAELFDNTLLAHQLEGDLCLALIEQFYTEEKTFSVTGDRFALDYHTINQRDPVTGQITNNVTAHKASFVVGEAPWRQTLAQAAFESAMEMLGQLAPVAPQVVTSIIDLVFEWSDLPNKNLILQRIRQVTGMSDPDKGDTPEVQQQKAQQKQMADAQFQAQMAQLQADIEEAKAKGLKLNAEAMAKRLEALYMAAQGAQVIALNPTVTPIADELLKSAGFVDAQGSGVIDPAAVPAQAEPMPAEPMPPEALPPEAMPPEAMPPELMQADGALEGGMSGSITPEADGFSQQP
jgi:hypothetical protein